MLIRALAFAAPLIVSVAVVADSAYVPERVYASGGKHFADFETMLADVARADVVVVGEEHDDPNTHRLELSLLEGLDRRRTDLILSLEMFERDVQEPLDHFGMGHVSEEEFLRVSRPWPDYAKDYKPLMDFAIAHDWPIVAADVPRTIAAAVAANGLDALASRPKSEQAWFAKDVHCPTGDRYFKHFIDAMGGHTGVGTAGATGTTQTLERFYFAQCLKDETMAESVAQAEAGASFGATKALVVHITGAFHSDYGDGTVARIRRRLPGKRVVTVTILPVATLDDLSPAGDTRKRADYLLYTTAEKPVASAADSTK